MLPLPKQHLADAKIDPTVSKTVVSACEVMRAASHMLEGCAFALAGRIEAETVGDIMRLAAESHRLSRDLEAPKEAPRYRA